MKVEEEQKGGTITEKPKGKGKKGKNNKDFAKLRLINYEIGQSSEGF